MLGLYTAIGVIVALLLVMALRTHGMNQRWLQRWPAISDDEFIARCSPGVDRTRALKARRIISEQLGVPYEHIHPEQSFADDLFCD